MKVTLSWMREFAPDNNPAAFVGVVLAYAALLLLGPGAYLLVFTTLFLVRIVNRTTGLAPRLLREPAQWLTPEQELQLYTRVAHCNRDPALGIRYHPSTSLTRLR